MCYSFSCMLSGGRGGDRCRLRLFILIQANKFKTRSRIKSRNRQKSGNMRTALLRQKTKTAIKNQKCSCNHKRNSKGPQGLA